MPGFSELFEKIYLAIVDLVTFRSCIGCRDCRDCFLSLQVVLRRLGGVSGGCTFVVTASGVFQTPLTIC